jgi:hemerythrin-like domain-containing protein
MKAETFPIDALQIIREEHSALAAVLRSILMMIDRPPADNMQQYFDALGAMLFYIDEFPERLHHRNESRLLFPKLRQRAPELIDVIQRLEADHESGEHRVRELQHLLLAWELIGDSRRDAFVSAAQTYVNFYLDHMRLEETHLLPPAAKLLSREDTEELNAAFAATRDPLAGGPRDPTYDRLFTRIVLTAPAPIGVGQS